jgi:hypothetical protein
MRALLWLGLPLVLVQGCAGSPVGEQLERSFDSPSTLVSESEEAGEKPESVDVPQPSIKPVLSTDAVAGPKVDVPKADVPKADVPKVAGPEVDDAEVTESKPADPPVKTSLSVEDNASTPESAGTSEQAPQPYRITIRLSAADPAAPAEAVTRALRGSDVRFAVERIERIESAIVSPPPPTSTP